MAPCSTSVVSRAPGSWRGGSPGPPVTAPGASVCRVTSARRPGSGGGSTSQAWAPAPPRRPSPARTIETVLSSSRRRSCDRRSSSPEAIRLATCRVGLVSPRSTWLSIGAETPERSARSRSERSIASRRAFTRGPTAATVGSAAVAITAVRYHVQACPTLERVQLPDALVLGAGGTLGEAWLRGVLNGLEAGAGLDFRDCEYLLGTSAGSIVAATLAGGKRPEAGERAAAQWAHAAALPEAAAFPGPRAK